MSPLIPFLNISQKSLYGQLLLGLGDGAFYALLSLGLSIIFGMLNIINFAQGALYMMGAFCAYFLLHAFGLGYWWALILTPFIIGAFGVLLERAFINPQKETLSAVAVLCFIGLAFALKNADFEAIVAALASWPAIGGLVGWIVSTFGLHAASFAISFIVLTATAFGLWAIVRGALTQKPMKEDHLYTLLLTIGLMLIIQGVFQNYFGSSGLPYNAIPPSLSKATDLGFMVMPNYRAWVIVFSLAVCLATWFMIEKTKLGAYLRAATENPTMVRAFGVNVPVMIALTFGFGCALAGLAGVLAAPITQVRPLMGADFIIVVFAVVVIGGMGSIMGSIVTGFMLGVAEGLTKVFYPEAANIVIFVIMAIVLIVKPAGLFGRTV